jgi:hypothetical protein
VLTRDRVVGVPVRVADHRDQRPPRGRAENVGGVKHPYRRTHARAIRLRAGADAADTASRRPRAQAPAEASGRDVFPRLDLDYQRPAEHGPRPRHAHRAPGRRQADAVQARGRPGHPSRPRRPQGPGTRQAQARDPVRGLLHPRPCDGAVAHRIDQRRADRQILLLVTVAAQAQQIRACRDGQHGGAGHAEHVPGRPHLQCVGDDHAGEPEFAAEQAAQGGTGHRGGQVAGELGHAQVAGHDGDGPRLDRGRERRQVALPQLGQAAFDSGDGMVRIGVRPAVTGKVLDARGHARALQAGYCGGRMPRHQVRVGAERAGADGRAVRRAEHVGTRRKVEVDSQGSQIKTDGLVYGPSGAAGR